MTADTHIWMRIVSNSHKNLRECMRRHYSHPNGFVGRNICYAVYYDKQLYGFTVSGSSTKHLPGRSAFLGLDDSKILNNIINNTFFHLDRVDGKYPCRNFVQKVIAVWEKRAPVDWKRKYRDPVIALETLVELPRTGECYLRSGWTEVGITKGYTCKRVAGNGTDSWGGKRLWDMDNLRPKRVFMKLVEDKTYELAKEIAQVEKRNTPLPSLAELPFQILFGSRNAND